MGSGPALAPRTEAEEAKLHVLCRFDSKIAYYWKSSQANKRSYKTTRYLVVVLGALVTLISSLSAAKVGTGWAAATLAIATPALAAFMAIISGISQAFQWGAAWSDMVIAATRLEKELDRISVTPAANLDAIKELGLLDDLVLAETQGFFQRLFGTGGPAMSESSIAKG
jgi:hypothetical protein